MNSTADAGKGGCNGFRRMCARISAGHCGAQIEKVLDPVLVGVALIASHEVAESMSMRGVVQDREELEGWLPGPNTQTNPVAD